MLRCLFFVLLAFFVLPVSSVASQLDSLVQVANTMKEDTNKVKLLSDLCFYHRSVHSDTAMNFGLKALRLAEKLKWKKGVAQALNDIAIVHMDKNEYPAALQKLESCLSIRKELKDDLGVAAVYNKMGIIYQEQFKLNDALVVNYKALEIYEQLGHKFYQSYIVNNLAIIHFNLRDYEQSLVMHNRALALRVEMGDEYGIAATHGGMANVYYETKDTVRAIENWELAIAGFRKMNKPMELAVQLNNYGGLLVRRKEYKKALPMLEECLAIRNRLSDRKDIASVLINLGEAQMQTGKYRDALNTFHQSLNYSRVIQARHEQLFAYMKLSRVHGFLNHPDSAFFFLEQYSLLKDSVFNDDLGEQVAEMRTKYETEKKEKELLEEKARTEQLAREKAESELIASNRMKWLWAIGGGAIALVFLILFLAQRRQRRLQAEKDAAIISEREKGIEAVITATEDERKRIARELHDGIGQQLGGLKLAFQQLSKKVEQSLPSEQKLVADLTKILDDSATEVRAISHQMMPKVLQEVGLVPAIEDMLRKSLGHSNVKYELESFGIEGRFAEKVEISLYRICQELINNIIKHSGASHVIVQVFRNKGYLIMIVEDNGRGFDVKASRDGIGMMNISSRINTINGDVNFEPSPGSGTVATVRVPVG